MSIITRPKLTQTQNQALNNFAISLGAQFKYTNTVNFATINNQLKFTARLYAGSSNCPDLSTISSDKEVQKIVSRLLINAKITSNRVTVNAAMKLAYLSLLWSPSSKQYQNAIAEVNASVDAHGSLSTAEKTSLKASANASFSLMLSSVFAKQSADTLRWSKTKFQLAAGLNTNTLYQYKNNVNTAAYIALGNTFKEVESESLLSVTSVTSSLSASLGAGLVVNNTDSIMSSVAGSVSMSSVFKGTTDAEIDQRYQSEMAKMAINAEASAALSAEVGALVTAGTLTDDEATDLKSELTSTFFGSMGIQAQYVCEGS